MTQKKTTLYIKLFTIAIAVLGVLSYAYFRSTAYLNGPEIIIEKPVNGETVNEPLITVSGYAKNISELFLNGRPIFINEKGHLEEELLLAYGYNLIELRAKDKFGKEEIKTIELIYK